MGGLRQKLFAEGGGFEGVTNPAPQRKINHTQVRSGWTVSAAPVKRLLQQLVYSHTGVKFGKRHSIYFQCPHTKECVGKHSPWIFNLILTHPIGLWKIH